MEMERASQKGEEIASPATADRVKTWSSASSHENEFGLGDYGGCWALLPAKR